MLLILSLWLGLLPSCATVPQAKPPGLAPQAAEIIQRLQARRQAVASIQLQGQVEIQNAGSEMLGDHLIVGRAPDSLRADIMGPFGRPQMSMALSRGVLTVLAFSENRAYRGPASPANLGRFLGVGLDGAALYDLLTGIPPMMAHEQARVENTPGSDLARLELANSSRGLLQVLEVHLGDYAVNQTWFQEPGGAVSLRCVYSDFRAGARGRVPYSMELKDQRERSISLMNTEIKINPLIDDNLFELTIPPVMPVEPLP